MYSALIAFNLLNTSSIKNDEYYDVSYPNIQNCMDISRFININKEFKQRSEYVDLLEETKQTSEYVDLLEETKQTSEYTNLLKETMRNQIVSLNTEDNIFEKDWNGYGAKPIRKESIDMMLRYLEKFDEDMMVPEVMLEAYGSVALYWGSEKGSFVLAFNDKKNQIEYSIVNKNTNHTGFGILEEIDDVKEFIGKIC